MSYQADIYTALTGDSRFTDLAGTRLFADVADGNTSTPYAVYQVISTTGETTHAGTRDIEFPLIQFSCWANTKAAAIALASAIVRILEGKTLLGYANASFVFSDQQGRHEIETNLFGETLEFRAHCNRN